MKNKKKIVCTWSGGIDSTALIGHLLFNGYQVLAVTLNFYEDIFVDRERKARELLLPHLKSIGPITILEKEGNFLWNFSPDGKEIPRRNRLIIDHIIETVCRPKEIYYIGVGEYIGADTWVVKDHVAGADADARALISYVYCEYGLDFRIITLADFGESRFKVDRIKLGYDIIGDSMFLTTNCLNNSEIHCGECYKCVERNIAFELLLDHDETVYMADPKLNSMHSVYANQMKGSFKNESKKS